MTVSEYLDNFGKSEKAEYKRLQKIVKSMVPDATEVISYGIPTFKYKGTYVLYFGAFKDHMSLFPGGYAHELKDKLKGFKLGKGTIKYTKDNLIPEDIVRELIKRRLDVINKKS
jgi:uncharacterized protein YdhG (YjbR/CyaY superfamily)